MIRLIFILLLTFYSSTLLAQPSAKDCQALKTGKFYFYSAGTKKGYIIIRNDTPQTEVELSTNDTSWWKASWPDACTLHVNFIGCTNDIPDKQKDFMRSHTTVIRVTEISHVFYTFSGTFEANGKEFGTMSDTIWFKPKRK